MTASGAAHSAGEWRNKSDVGSFSFPKCIGAAQSKRSHRSVCLPVRLHLHVANFTPKTHPLVNHTCTYLSRLWSLRVHFSSISSLICLTFSQVECCDLGLGFGIEREVRWPSALLLVFFTVLVFSHRKANFTLVYPQEVAPQPRTSRKE
jgi:hypothetical protein